VPIVEIAEKRGIALHVLEQLFASLRRAGILKSQRGVRGGYSFARDAGDITVLDVIECIDGPLRPAADAPAAGECIWTDARAALSAQLNATSIADLADREAQASGNLMFHI
jgi:Rrf2 family protein